MFSHTPEWRVLHAGRDFTRMPSGEAYCFLSRLFSALERWHYRRLPRAVGLPRTEAERLANRERSRREEAVTRIAVPDDEHDDWVTDRRPSAAGSPIPYRELNPELEEALEIDFPGLSRTRSQA